MQPSFFTLPPIVHTVFRNIKAWLFGSHCGVSAKNLPRRFPEWTYRFNRRNRSEGAGPWLIRRADDCANITYKEIVAGAQTNGAAQNRRLQPNPMLAALVG